MHRSIHSLCHNPHKLRSFLFPLIVCQMLLQYDWKPPVVNSVHWTPDYKRPHSWRGIPEQKPSHEVQGTVSRPLRQDCAEAQIWGRVQKKLVELVKSYEYFWGAIYITNQTCIHCNTCCPATLERAFTGSTTFSEH